MASQSQLISKTSGKYNWDLEDKKRILILKDQDRNLEYALVQSVSTPFVANLKCYDTKNRKGIIGKNVQKKIQVEQGDLVLVSKREYQDSKCDIVLKYFPNEIYKLVNRGHVNQIFVGETNLQLLTGLEQKNNNKDGTVRRQSRRMSQISQKASFDLYDSTSEGQTPQNIRAQDSRKQSQMPLLGAIQQDDAEDFESKAGTLQKIPFIEENYIENNQEKNDEFEGDNPQSKQNISIVEEEE